MKRLALAILATAGLLIAPAHAGSSPTLTIAPAPARVGDVVTGSGCGYQPKHWYETDTYGPAATGDGPLDSSSTSRADSLGCIGETLLDPASSAGTYSVYVYGCGAKGTGDGCVYGSHNRALVDRDFTVS